MEEFDYIVIGAGTAGSVIANRLSEDPGARVLVLEAGGNWIPAAVDTAPLWFTLLGSPIDWGYQSVPQPGLGGRVTYEPRGKAPGGTSNLYIMMHVRGHPSDFDNWAYQGAAGWSYQDLLPYFTKLEAQEDPSGPGTGTGGPQTVTNARDHGPNPMSRTFIDACAELGYPKVDDFNGPSMIGAGWHHLDVKDGTRQGALVSYLEPALGRPNLTLRTDAQVMRLVFEGDRCVGVQYQQGDGGAAVRPDGEGRAVPADDVVEPGMRTLRAAREVILCAGAIESPRLLQLSGIGDADRLREFGIPLVAQVPGVGENFHNHVLAGLIAETVDPVEQGRQNLSESALFTTSQPGMVAPDLQIAFVHVPFDIIVGQQHPNAVSILPGVVRPQSRGWVRLASADPFAAPLVNPNYLADRSDLERLVAAVKLSREIFAAPSFRSVLRGELMPGPDVTTDADLERFVRERADSYHHQVGSCRMGIDDLAVVDPLLRVRGVTGVRVVDASVLPSVPSGNCHTAITAVAERAADLIKRT
ncbi:GMC family oxidoreductase N-terminal domain-containing protein [Actinomadura barringtoniae]|uniref:GMC family oxidoreductase N-terminal domain-containing protein n=1 Tax=Actinomadura barringtoniae TaxID=1427535 RepID=A0A939P9Y9_9ACTN|nr:GMC family oxidoreductase N-terminal domain-containing protein [Actinomadura barringtoniae]MBO2448751.1 GMC family oxidoreductase N-terminal domain-containing protein [Actinomadura barringtoniae]